MKTLSALVERESFEVPPFALDHFQKKVREGLHLEFFLARGRLILTPHLAPLTTAEATAAEEAQVATGSSRTSRSCWSRSSCTCSTTCPCTRRCSRRTRTTWPSTTTG